MEGHDPADMDVRTPEGTKLTDLWGMLAGCPSLRCVWACRIMRRQQVATSQKRGWSCDEQSNQRMYMATHVLVKS
jgi:hypothetical protein